MHNFLHPKLSLRVYFTRRGGREREREMDIYAKKLKKVSI